jgi:hypothetical protein
MELEEKEKTIILDGQPVTLQFIQEQKQRTDIRIVEVKEGEYKTLTRMLG